MSAATNETMNKGINETMLQTLVLAIQDQITDHETTQDFTDFKNWLEDKKFKDTDFGFLKILESNIQMHTVQTHTVQTHLVARCFYHCYQLKASFSETLQILETASELILMGHHESLFEKTALLSQWRSHLKSLRYPHATKADEELKSRLESLPWPYGSKVKFERRGDRAGVELKFFITSHADLTKITAALERVKEQL